ncbi:unnamed protein product, partial [Porites evermanni]
MSWACLVSFETVAKDEKFSASRKDIKALYGSYEGKYPAPSFAKVGFTNNCQQRLGNLKAGNPYELSRYETYHVCNKDAAKTAAHDSLDDYKVQMGGGTEWFYYISI